MFSDAVTSLLVFFVIFFVPVLTMNEASYRQIEGCFLGGNLLRFEQCWNAVLILSYVIFVFFHFYTSYRHQVWFCIAGFLDWFWTVL